ncbi:MFS transporter [Thermoactinospora rubra]|uniref:MFS transporter n=1 Tax=Thermoactinospora rubra TaxID=1088767 RepID=UPI000A114420|nr:MFS transporter [Thermoactinospora rubra]
MDLLVVRLASATAVGSFGLAAGGVSGALLAVEVTGRPETAGLPLGLLVAGSAAGALAVSRLTGRWGRGPALALAYAGGAAGAAVVVAAAWLASFPLVLAGSLLMGVANAAVFLARYAAAALAAPRRGSADPGFFPTHGERRGDAWAGRAIGAVFVAAAVGAVAGPNLLGPAGAVAQALGLPYPTGLYLVAVPAFALAGLLLLPLRGGRAEQVTWREIGPALRGRAAVAGVSALGAVNLVMVGVMAVAPVHLSAHGHGPGLIGVAIGVHVLGMFLPSPLTGRAADRYGGAAVACAGIVVLGIAGVLGLVLDQGDALAMTLVLAVLGAGWNAGAVGASTLLAGAVPGRLRPAVEGVGEVAMGAGAAVAGPGAGLLAAGGGLAAVMAAGAAASLLALLAVRALSRRPGPDDGRARPPRRGWPPRAWRGSSTRARRPSSR